MYLFMKVNMLHVFVYESEHATCICLSMYFICNDFSFLFTRAHLGNSSILSLLMVLLYYNSTVQIETYHVLTQYSCNLLELLPMC